VTSRHGAHRKWPRPKDSDADADADVTLTQALARLRANHWGVGFIYEALAMLAARFTLHDVVIVIDDERVGTQAFRLGGRAVGPDQATLLREGPGVYCDPPVVPDDELRTLLEACESELVRLRTFDPRSEPAPLPARRSRASSSASLGRTPKVQPLQRFTIAEGDDDWRDEPRRGGARSRLNISRVLVFVDVVSLLLALVSVHGALRFVFGLVLGVTVPGWSIVGLLRLRNSALEIGLTMATSFSILLISAQILMTAHLWHLVGFEMLLCLACLPSLWIQSRRRWMDEGDLP